MNGTVMNAGLDAIFTQQRFHGIALFAGGEENRIDVIRRLLEFPNRRKRQDHFRLGFGQKLIVQIDERVSLPVELVEFCELRQADGGADVIETVLESK